MNMLELLVVPHLKKTLPKIIVFGWVDRPTFKRISQRYNESESDALVVARRMKYFVLLTPSKAACILLRFKTKSSMSPASPLETKTGSWSCSIASCDVVSTRIYARKFFWWDDAASCYSKTWKAATICSRNCL